MKQYPAASKAHTHYTSHSTLFESILSHISELSQISLMSHCFAQTPLQYLHFEFPLICSILRVCIILKPYVSATNKKRQAVAPKDACICANCTQCFYLYANLQVIFSIHHPPVHHPLNLHLLKTKEKYTIISCLVYP